MKRVVNISKNAAEAQEWDIKQHLSLSVEERQAAAHTLKERVYGKNSPDIREAERNKWRLPTFPKVLYFLDSSTPVEDQIYFLVSLKSISLDDD